MRGEGILDGRPRGHWEGEGKSERGEPGVGKQRWFKRMVGRRKEAQGLRAHRPLCGRFIRKQLDT